mgnify:FL=1
MPHPKTLDLIDQHLFSTPEEMEAARVPGQIRNRIVRIRDLYTYWLTFPRLSEREITAELCRRYPIGKQQAYADLRMIKTCLGRFNQVTKEYDMYRFRQLLDEGLEMARAKGDAGAFAKLLSSYGKMARLDKEEADAPAYADIVPQQFALSVDPSVLGIKPVTDWRTKAEKLRKQWANEAQVIEVEPLPPETS